jgi:hypothetical protein
VTDCKKPYKNEGVLLFASIRLPFFTGLAAETGRLGFGNFLSQALRSACRMMVPRPRFRALNSPLLAACRMVVKAIPVSALASMGDNASRSVNGTRSF